MAKHDYMITTEEGQHGSGMCTCMTQHYYASYSGDQPINSEHVASSRSVTLCPTTMGILLLTVGMFFAAISHAKAGAYITIGVAALLFFLIDAARCHYAKSSMLEEADRTVDRRIAALFESTNSSSAQTQQQLQDTIRSALLSATQHGYQT